MLFVSYYSCLKLQIYLWIYSLQQVLLQSEEELLAKRTTNLTKEGAVTKPRKTLGKMKVQGVVSSHFSPQFVGFGV